jgi:hypothetical protein
VVQALPEASHDWSWVRGLTVCFWTSPEEYNPRHVIDCAKGDPKKIYLWDCKNERGYDVWVLPTPSSVHFHPEQQKMVVDTVRWLPVQEKQFAQGEMVWN